VVVGVDGSTRATAALRWAVEDLAERGGGELVALMTWSYPAFISSPMIEYPAPSPSEMTSSTRAALAHALDGLEIPSSVRVDQMVVESTPAQALIDASKDADLLVVGSRGHGEITGMLLGSVSLHCVTHAHCPVVVVR
jgi:nucleotide-binding universal stress UspA family protein